MLDLYSGAHVTVTPYHGTSLALPAERVVFMYPYAHSTPGIPEFVGADMQGRLTAYRYVDIVE